VQNRKLDGGSRHIPGGWFAVDQAAFSYVQHQTGFSALARFAIRSETYIRAITVSARPPAELPRRLQQIAGESRKEGSAALSG
jgi:hypothetical protein